MDELALAQVLHDFVPVDNLAYLLKYDTVYGRYDRQVEADDDLVKVMSGYENEWGSTAQMVREAARIAREAVPA